jgi:cytochrome c-type biogenesis protein CcmH
MFLNLERARYRVFITVWLSLALAAPSVPSLSAIKKSLACTCECGMTVDACEGAMTCQAAAKLTAQVRDFLDRGLSEKQILAGFVNLYGEEILAAPTKQGFNLLAWVLPFFLVVLMGGGLVLLVRRWEAKSHGIETNPATPVGSPEDCRYEQQLDEYLERIEE